MHRTSLRGFAAATATAVAATGIALGVGAWTEYPASSTTPAASVAALAPTAAQQAQERRTLVEHRGAAAEQAAAKRVAAEKAAREKAAREKAAREEAAREKAAREEAARAEAAREEAAREEAAREEAEQRAAESRDSDRSSRDASRSGDPRSIAAAMVSEHGWSSDQFSCLDSLWQKESNWDHTAQNPSSGAYGIPQSLPGSKMASAGSDWESNPATQIAWGLGYIADRYGSPCSAWEHSEANNWY